MDDNRSISNVNSVVGGSGWALAPAGETKNDLEDSGGQLAYQPAEETADFVSPVNERGPALAGGIGRSDSDAYLAAVVQMQVHGELQERVKGASALRLKQVAKYGAASPVAESAPLEPDLTTDEPEKLS